MHEGLKKCSHADSLRSVQLQILTNHKNIKEISFTKLSVKS